MEQAPGLLSPFVLEDESDPFSHHEFVNEWTPHDVCQLRVHPQGSSAEAHRKPGRIWIYKADQRPTVYLIDIICEAHAAYLAGDYNKSAQVAAPALHTVPPNPMTRFMLAIVLVHADPTTGLFALDIAGDAIEMMEKRIKTAEGQGLHVSDWKLAIIASFRLCFTNTRLLWTNIVDDRKRWRDVVAYALWSRELDEIRGHLKAHVTHTTTSTDRMKHEDVEGHGNMF